MSLAPAVAKDGFAFGGDFYAEASGHNRHRRFTLAELKELFKSGSDKARPSHFFESQLIHYGLQPSKTKSVARMRLYDAVNEGKLSVPAHIQKLESELKKEWTKNEREAKKALKAPAASSSSAPSKGTKRKAESSNVDITVNVDGVNVTVSTNSSSSQANAKKAKTTTATTPKSTTSAKPKASAAKPKASTNKPKASASQSKPKAATSKATTPKTTASKAAAPKAAAPKKGATVAPSSSASASGSTPAKRQTARRGGITPRPGRGGSTAKAADPKPPRTKQTARRSGAFVATGRIHAPSQTVNDYDGGYGGFGYDEPPPPYSEYGGAISSDNDDYGDNRDDGSDSDELRPLGLLNGRYWIKSEDVSGQWSHYDEDDFSLVLTLSGTELWGKFDLGVITGILRFSERPWESSHEPLHFTWRGEEDQGPVVYGNNNGGSITFLGDGRIEGEFDFMGLGFRGGRLGGQSTRSEVEASAMRSEWNGYTEDEYERQNRARW
ncbi:hypothetical protein F5X99DRAFT_5062 [Biscogniauxia marginata]|nr:hypothetical protein F5X99DRAFT_5062 [Biscogniauxia marginata]